LGGAAPPSPLDWGPLLALAAHEGLDGLLLRALASAAPPLAPALREALRQRAIRHEARNLLLLDEAGRLGARLSAQGLPALLLKGAALLQGAYPDLACRGMVDLDLLLRPADLDAARAVARSLGYRLAQPARARSRLRHCKQNLLRERGGLRLRLELHPAFDGLGHRGPDAATALARARSLGPEAGGLRQPAAVDLALHLALHASVEGAPRRLRDGIDLLALQRHEDLDLAAVAHAAVRFRCAAAWDDLLRRAAADGLLPAGALAPPQHRRGSPLRALRLPARWSGLRGLLLAEGPRDAAHLALRVLARRSLDAWAERWEGPATPGEPLTP